MVALETSRRAIIHPCEILDISEGYDLLIGMDTFYEFGFGISGLPGLDRDVGHMVPHPESKVYILACTTWCYVDPGGQEGSQGQQDRLPSILGPTPLERPTGGMCCTRSKGLPLVSRRYLGLFNYFREHIPLYAKLEAPLERLSKATDLIQAWGENEQRAFDSMMKVLSSARVLSFPDFG